MQVGCDAYKSSEAGRNYVKAGQKIQDSLSVPNLSNSSLGHGSVKASRHQGSWHTPPAVSALITVESGGLSVLPTQ